MMVAPQTVATPKSNEVLSALRKKDDGHAAMFPPAMADIVAVIVPQPHIQQRPDSPHTPPLPTTSCAPIYIMPMSNNQDLAEADQICNDDDDHAIGGIDPANNNIYLMEADFINNPNASGDSMGAVGGLPDLANVTQASGRIMSFEEESASLANAEVERITSQSFEIAAEAPNNNSATTTDSKQNNQ